MWLKTGSPRPPKPDSPAAAASLTDEGGQPVRLGSSLGGGKEGEVHEVLGSRYVVKLFRPPNRTPDREQKLRHDRVGIAAVGLVVFEDRRDDDKPADEIDQKHPRDGISAKLIQ